MRQSLFAQDAQDHFAIAALAADSVLHDGAPVRRLKIIQIGQDVVVHGQRQVVLHRSDLPFRAPSKTRIHRTVRGKIQVTQFIERRGLRGLFRETVALLKGGHLVGMHRLHDVIVKFAKARLLREIETAG